MVNGHNIYYIPLSKITLLEIVLVRKQYFSFNMTIII